MIRFTTFCCLLFLLASCFNARKATESDSGKRPKKSGVFDGMGTALENIDAETNRLDSLRVKLGDSLSTYGDPKLLNVWKSIKSSSDALMKKLLDYQSQVKKNPQFNAKESNLYDDLFMHQIRVENILKANQKSMRVPVMIEPRIDFNKKFNDLNSSELKLEFLRDLSLQIRKSDIALLNDLLKPKG